ncbi:MAG: hypothetical protein PHD11_07455 [Bacteroidales bacterium]|nr:hypothetical protein [Bacteroidales bacterium]MDD4670883.1 hypothetical protein [Bacteroidales bacterium]
MNRDELKLYARGGDALTAPENLATNVEQIVRAILRGEGMKQ